MEIGIDGNIAEQFKQTQSQSNAIPSRKLAPMNLGVFSFTTYHFTNG